MTTGRAKSASTSQRLFEILTLSHQSGQEKDMSDTDTYLNFQNLRRFNLFNYKLRDTISNLHCHNLFSFTPMGTKKETDLRSPDQIG